eukprot:TRINITY_DN5603_c0_g1_i1.p1 TRINITY_DN5603_c0_g1~~TRINITY_DN5603_c0_g1_i1.p1  ORF type:complete len:208 (-),score=37.53 TRINITY_DN5603_c0_g1_i1:77-700(-)
MDETTANWAKLMKLLTPEERLQLYKLLTPPVNRNIVPQPEVDKSVIEWFLGWLGPIEPHRVQIFIKDLLPQPWFLGKVTKFEAEFILDLASKRRQIGFKRSSFTMRFSERIPQTFSVERSNLTGAVTSFRIEYKNNAFCQSGSSHTFPTVLEQVKSMATKDLEPVSPDASDWRALASRQQPVLTSSSSGSSNNSADPMNTTAYEGYD